MRQYLPLLRQTALHAASVGTVVGGVFAAREIAAQQFFPHHLWRTAVWMLSYYTLRGALLGATSAAFLVLWLRIWQVDPPSGGTISERSAEGSSSRLVSLFAIWAAAVILLTPAKAPQVLGLSHWFAVVGAVGLVWVIVSSYLADMSEQDPESEVDPPLFGLLWYQFLGLSYVAALSHLWGRAWPAHATGFLAGVGLLSAVAVYHLFYRPVRYATFRLEEVARAAARVGAARIPALVMAALTVLWVASWGIGARARTRAIASGTNLILIAADTLRWDVVSMVSADEHGRDLTPNIRERLASRGTVFSRSYSQAPWTLPSFASMFTGLYPEQHGAEHVWSRLEPHHVTLAEVLRDNGYRTMAVISGHFVTSKVGMTQGFRAYDESLAADSGISSAGGVTDRALKFLKERGEDRFFLFAHYYDPHFPYLTHSEIDLGPPRADERVDVDTRYAGWWGMKREGRGLVALDGNLVPYKEEVASIDLHIGRLLAYIEEEGLWEDSCVVFVADHGEEFFEHGGVGHDHTLYDELIRVPLCVAAPSLDLPKVVSQPVETRWLFQSLQEMAGVRRPGRMHKSPSLLAPSDIGGEGYVRSSTHPRGQAMARLTRGRATEWLSALCDARYKLIADHVTGRSVLFDLLEDPEECRDLSAEQPDVADRLTDALAARDATLLDVSEAALPPPVSEEQLEHLNSLGYLF